MLCSSVSSIELTKNLAIISNITFTYRRRGTFDGDFNLAVWRILPKSPNQSLRQHKIIIFMIT